MKFKNRQNYNGTSQDSGDYVGLVLTDGKGTGEPSGVMSVSGLGVANTNVDTRTYWCSWKIGALDSNQFTPLKSTPNTLKQFYSSLFKIDINIRFTKV